MRQTRIRRTHQHPHPHKCKYKYKYSSLQVPFFLLCLLCTSPPIAALRILLTNDDGLDKSGLQLLRTALLNDGHDVYTFAPANDRSGLSASVSLTVPYTDIGDRQVIITGPPATCVVAGIDIMEQNLLGMDEAGARPDLVVVGISDGFPTGAQTLHASSVGAALTALGRGIPTLAVAALPPSQETDAYYTRVADFTVRFITEWTTTFPIEEMTTGYGIKIAYPAILDDQRPVQGVALADHGRQAPLSLGYVQSPDNPLTYQIAPVFSEEPIDTDSESAIVDAGFVSVLPISSRYYVLERDFNVRYILTLRRMLRGLTP